MSVAATTTPSTTTTVTVTATVSPTASASPSLRSLPSSCDMLLDSGVTETCHDLVSAVVHGSTEFVDEVDGSCTGAIWLHGGMSGVFFLGLIASTIVFFPWKCSKGSSWKKWCHCYRRQGALNGSVCDGTSDLSTWAVDDSMVIDAAQQITFAAVVVLSITATFITKSVSIGGGTTPLVAP